GGINAYQYVPNPTGWIDPLGLNTCPGGDGCKPNATAEPKPKVNDGTPALPHQPKTERQARIDQLTESNAKRKVLGWEQKYDMHATEKHGPEIPDEALKQRSIDGTNPTTGTKGPISSSSQFKSWKMQLHAINKALGKMQSNSPAPTGFDKTGNPVVVVELLGAGRGYKPNSKDPRNPKYIESMDSAEIRLDKNNPTRPFTAFPK
ncbi:type IV secretion protein Rhs, partial [Pseudomonas sp. O64]